MQMGRIPLLTREEEIDAAMKIDDARFLFRNTMLATDFMLRGAYDALVKVYEKKLRLDRTIEVSVTNKAEKKRIMLRLKPNLRTLKHLLHENKKDYYFAVTRSNPMKDRRQAWKRLVVRRNKCVKLIEESNLRYSRLQPLFDQLDEINSRMQALTELLKEGRGNGIRWFTKLRRNPGRTALPDGTDLRNTGNAASSGVQNQEASSGPGRGQANSLGWKPAFGRFDRQEVPKPWLEFS